MNLMSLLFSIFFLLLTSCQSPSSYGDFRELGRAKTKSLISTLKQIRTKEQLIVKEDDLKRQFKDLSQLLEKVDEYRLSHPHIPLPPLTPEDQELSDQLRLELLRIYRLEGGRAILNECRGQSSR